MNILRNIFLAIWTLWFLWGILRNYSHYTIIDWIIIISFTLTPYIIVWVISRIQKNSKKVANAQSDSTNNDNPIPDLNAEATELDILQNATSNSYVEPPYATNRINEKTISDEEVPNLVLLGQRIAIANLKVPQLTQQIVESYRLMCSTNNPETLCNRYKFIIEKIDELALFQEQGFFDKDTINRYKSFVTDDELYKLILVCYQKYLNKARSELKTKNGLNNRIKKFWQVIYKNVSIEFYNTSIIHSN